MRTRKRICAAVLTAVFAAVLCLTGCSLSPRLYEGVWAAEDLEVNGLSIDRLEMAVELCSEEPAWNEYDTFTYYEGDGEWSIYFRISFLIDGVRSEFVTADFHKPNNRLMCSLTWKGDDLVFLAISVEKRGRSILTALWARAILGLTGRRMIF